MEIMQNDIFGKHHNARPEKDKKPSMAAPKSFPRNTLDDGLNEAEASANAMLIHKILQKRLVSGNLCTQRQIDVFMRILSNELAIKSGLMEASTATRDSLISFYVMSKI